MNEERSGCAGVDDSRQPFNGGPCQCSGLQSAVDTVKWGAAIPAMDPARTDFQACEGSIIVEE